MTLIDTDHYAVWRCNVRIDLKGGAWKGALESTELMKEGEEVVEGFKTLAKELWKHFIPLYPNERKVFEFRLKNSNL